MASSAAQTSANSEAKMVDHYIAKEKAADEERKMFMAKILDQQPTPSKKSASSHRKKHSATPLKDSATPNKPELLKNPANSSGKKPAPTPVPLHDLHADDFIQVIDSHKTYPGEVGVVREGVDVTKEMVPVSFNNGATKTSLKYKNLMRVE